MKVAPNKATSEPPKWLGATVTAFALTVLLMATLPWVAGGQGDSPTDLTSFVPEPPPDKIDASINKSVSPDLGPVVPGTTLTYKLAYTMSKDHLDATDVYITDTLSTDVDFGGIVVQPLGLSQPVINPPKVGWYTPGMAAGVTGTIVFTVTVNTDVLSGTTILNRADITSTAQDDADETNNHDTASSVTRAPFRAYLPLVEKRYRSVAIANGGFETGDTSGWSVSGDPPLPAPRVVSTDPKEGSYHLLLGDPSYCNAPQPGQPGDRYSIASQEIFVPGDLITPTLTFWYRVITYDHLTWTPKSDGVLGDSFDVYVGGDLALRDNYENYPDPAPGCGGLPMDSDWRRPDNPWSGGGPPQGHGRVHPLVFDLTEWSGKWVEVRFELWTRIDGWFNTWAYVDDVRVVEGD